VIAIYANFHSCLRKIPIVMRHLVGLILVGLLLVNTACAPYNDSELHGTWEGVEVLEEGESLNVDPTEVGFTFSEDNGYTFRSTLNYKEAGTYQVQDTYLYTTDTLNQASTEKAVEITKLSEDSLFIRMMEQGQERTLKLVRQEEE